MTNATTWLAWDAANKRYHILMAIRFRILHTPYQHPKSNPASPQPVSCIIQYSHVGSPLDLCIIKLPRNCDTTGALTSHHYFTFTQFNQQINPIVAINSNINRIITIKSEEYGVRSLDNNNNVNNCQPLHLQPQCHGTLSSQFTFYPRPSSHSFNACHLHVVVWSIRHEGLRAWIKTHECFGFE